MNTKISKAELLEAMVLDGASSDKYLTAEEIYKSPFFKESIHIDALRTKLRRYYWQELVARRGKGCRGDPYRYSVTLKGWERIDYEHDKQKKTEKLDNWQKGRPRALDEDLLRRLSNIEEKISELHTAQKKEKMKEEEERKKQDQQNNILAALEIFKAGYEFEKSRQRAQQSKILSDDVWEKLVKSMLEKAKENQRITDEKLEDLKDEIQIRREEWQSFKDAMIQRRKKEEKNNSIKEIHEKHDLMMERLLTEREETEREIQQLAR